MHTSIPRTASVLIVEDERIVAKDLQQTLAAMGYDAFAIATSGDEAISQASERRPDVVFMDIRIKGQRDGIETAQILRNRFDVPVVYLTAHADAATIERAKRTEPLGYLMKPVRAAELRSAIEIALYVHEMERKLRERERWYATTLRSMADAVVAVNVDAHITFVNPAAEELIGMSSEDAIDRPVQQVMRLLDGQARSVRETPLHTALREARSVMISDVGLVNVATGAVRTIGDNAAPVIDGDHVLGAVMVFRDVTEEKRAQKQIELADRLTSLGTMAAGVAHEVNNPLAVVVSNATFAAEELRRCLDELAAGERLPARAIRERLDEVAMALDDVESAGLRIARVVEDLRTFSRPPARTSDRANVIRAVEWATRATAVELRHRAQLVTRLDPVPAVEGEESRLAQVFVNLLINAAHAIAPGDAKHNQVSVRTRTDESQRAVVEIRDTGVGISDEIRDHIFEPFFTTKPFGSGTGLGLPICSGIITSFGGELHVETRVGQGTTFRVILPPARAVENAGVSLSVPSCPVLAGPPRRGRILLVDDEDLVLRSIKRVLRDHDVVCMLSAREALALIDSGERFDLVMSDVVMQGMSGIEFYEALVRRHPDMARDLVFLSGGAISAKIEAFLVSVPNLRLDKPIEVADLLATVQRLLAERPA
jgi:PAS domain S-box-containing protein